LSGLPYNFAMRRPFSLFVIALLSASSLQAGPRFGSGSISREGPRGGSVEAQGTRVGRFATGSVEAEGPRGGTYNADGTRAGRFATGSVDAEGPRGGSYEAQGTRVGRYSTGSVNAEGPNGGSVNKSWTTWNGYRRGYVYTGGVYRPANITVNAYYAAPIGIYVGWNVVARPYYVSCPAFATCPVEVSVQVELQRRGYYGGPVDGDIGPQTSAAIAKYQKDNGLPPTGQINQALLKSLNII
jgi:hypothetical protein